MVRLIIDIPDEKAARLIDAFAARNNYQEQITPVDGPPVPNPQTKAAFLRERVLAFIKESAWQGIVSEATTRAGRDAATQANQDVTW